MFAFIQSRQIKGVQYTNFNEILVRMVIYYNLRRHLLQIDSTSCVDSSRYDAVYEDMEYSLTCGSITVRLTSCWVGLDLTQQMHMQLFIISKAAESKQAAQEISRTVVLPM